MRLVLAEAEAMLDVYDVWGETRPKRSESELSRGRTETGFAGPLWPFRRGNLAPRANRHFPDRAASDVRSNGSSRTVNDRIILSMRALDDDSGTVWPRMDVMISPEELTLKKSQRDSRQTPA